MNTPKVQIVIDKKWDKEVFVYFLDEKNSEHDFGWERIVSLHPETKKVRGKSIDEKMTILDQYIDNYYRIHIKDMESGRIKIAGAWKNIAHQFFTEIKKIFGSLDFYKADNIKAALSITKAGVIGDDNASFQIWYKTVKDIKEVRRHFAHEILHFFYYAYLKKKNLQQLANSWDLAEIFNVVILGLPQFINMIGKEDVGYKQHEKYFSYYKNLWQKSSSLDEYLKSTSINNCALHTE